MKGIIIFESPSINGTVNAEALEYCNVVSQLVPACCEVVTLTGNFDSHTIAKCNIEKDTYDFETGALIALMKMCGVDKVVRACNEAFSEDTFKTYATKYEKELRTLKKDFDKVNGLKDFYKKDNGELRDKVKELEKAVSDAADTLTELNDKYDKAMDGLRKAKELDELREKQTKELNENINELFESDKYWKSQVNRLCSEKHRLEEENEKLKSDKDKSWKNYQRNIQKKQDRINELERAYKASNDDKAKLVEYYQREIKKLEAENEKLKLDCEKLQHGYIDTDMLICGGRACGKQYKALVELFKKLDKKKVQEAYKEAYGDRVIWCSSQPSTRDMLDALLEASKYAIPTEFTFKIDQVKPPTKREQKWERILEIHKKSNVVIEVKREDVSTFLHEIEDKIPEIRWASRQKIFEAKGTIKDIYGALKTCDRIYFRIRKENEISYSSDPHIYQYRDLEHISYLPPMRWDLFKKGRIIVGVRNNNELEEFRKEVERNTGIKNIPTCHTNLCLFYMFDKDNYKIILNSVTAANIAKINGHKVVYWEDVR